MKRTRTAHNPNEKKEADNKDPNDKPNDKKDNLRSADAKNRRRQAACADRKGRPRIVAGGWPAGDPKAADCCWKAQQGRKGFDPQTTSEIRTTVVASGIGEAGRRGQEQSAESRKPSRPLRAATRLLTLTTDSQDLQALPESGLAAEARKLTKEMDNGDAKGRQRRCQVKLLKCFRKTTRPGDD